MQLGTSIRAVALASVGIFAVVGCGCNNGAPSLNLAPAAQQILRLNPATEANSFDPTQQTYSYEAAVGGQNFESLLKPKADLSDVQPAAAKSYDVSSDGLTYTFHLQPSAKWSDGKPVTSSHWASEYHPFLNPPPPAGYMDPLLTPP